MPACLHDFGKKNPVRLVYLKRHIMIKSQKPGDPGKNCRFKEEKNQSQSQMRVFTAMFFFFFTFYPNEKNMLIHIAVRSCFVIEGLKPSHRRVPYLIFFCLC